MNNFDNLVNGILNERRDVRPGTEMEEAYAAVIKKLEAGTPLTSLTPEEQETLRSVQHELKRDKLDYNDKELQKLLNIYYPGKTMDDLSTRQQDLLRYKRKKKDATLAKRWEMWKHTKARPATQAARQGYGAGKRVAGALGKGIKALTNDQGTAGASM
jgi:hypothetical protein